MQKTLQASLIEKLNEAIHATFSDVEGGDAEVVQSTQEKFGHYQCNSCLKLAKQLGKNPREVAKAIVTHLEGDKDLAKVEIAGPGFINLTLTNELLGKRINHLLCDPFLGVARREKPKKVIVEFSSPNVAKELHVGHLRSTIIGDSLARIFTFLGEDVLRLNHIGDWGTQFGMLIHYLKGHEPAVLSGEEKTDLPHLMHWYREAKQCFDKDPEFKKASQEQVVSLQGGEEEAISAWKMICEISRKGFQEIYDFLDVKIIERGESFYNPFLAEVIEDLQEKGLVEISGGAKCIFLPGMKGRDGSPLPMIVQKSDGGFNYATTDMAALRHRVEEEKAERIIILTDAGQALHFQMVFGAGEKSGYFDPAKVRLDHVTFGVVLGPDGKKFKTREGKTEKLIDLLDEAVMRAEKIMDERLIDATEEEKKQAAKALGVGAIKYADLSGNRVKDYLFSYDKMLRFEGNTAAFLLYAYVRIQGIKRKGNWDIEKMIKEESVSLEHPSEVSLALHLCQLEEILLLTTKDLMPNRLADYLYALAEKFNAFYRDCRVEGDKAEKSRLLLAEAAARVLKQGLELLGLKTVSRM